MLNPNPRDFEPESIPAADVARAGGYPPDLWLGCRFRHSLAAPPGEPGRVVEVDVIVCPPAAWARSAERLADGWETHVDRGLLVAERIVG